MATNYGWMVTYGDLIHKVIQHFDHVILQGHLTNENHYISTIRAAMTTKLDKMVTYLERLLTIKSCKDLITWSCKFTWWTKTNISTTRVRIATKFALMIIYFNGPIKSHDPLITRYCDIKWQTKSIISPISQCLWPPNLVGWWLT